MQEGFINDGKRMLIYTYSTEHLQKKDKVRFYYALKGRDGKSGLIKRTNTIHLGKTVLLAPLEHDRELQEFLSYWKCPYTRRTIIVGETTTHTPEDNEKE